MSIILNGTTGITTPDVTSDGSLKIDASAPDNSLVVDASGNVGVGTVSPTEKLTVNGNIKLGTSGTVWAYGPSTSGRSFFSNSDESAYVGVYGSAYGSNLSSVVQLTAGTTTTAILNATGSFSLAGATRTANGTGITFPATQNASSNANTLDDYEEGSWTPTMGGATFSLSTSVGRYVKIGKSVTVWVGVQGTYSSPTASFSVSNLPFSVGGDLSLYARPVGAMSTISGITFTGSICCEVLNGYTSMYFEDNLGSGARSDLNSSNFASGGFRFHATVTYEASS